MIYNYNLYSIILGIILGYLFETYKYNNNNYNNIIDISHDIIMLICLLLKLSNISLSLIVSLLTKHIIHFINNQYV